MHIIVCLDDRNGILFNGRRLSSDREVCKRIVELAAGKVLRMCAYSAMLFPQEKLHIDDDFLQKAEQEDICFVENADILSCWERIHTVTVFRWNRAYPSDVKFPMHNLDTWQRETIGEFQGSSHEKITELRYTRCV